MKKDNWNHSKADLQEWSNKKEKKKCSKKKMLKKKYARMAVEGADETITAIRKK